MLQIQSHEECTHAFLRAIPPMVWICPTVAKFTLCEACEYWHASATIGNMTHQYNICGTCRDFNAEFVKGLKMGRPTDAAALARLPCPREHHDRMERIGLTNLAKIAINIIAPSAPRRRSACGRCAGCKGQTCNELCGYCYGIMITMRNRIRETIVIWSSVNLLTDCRNMIISPYVAVLIG